MAAVSLTDYASQQAEIARRQKFADMLSEQGQQDIPIQSYQGIQAPIPWTALLAKALQTGVGAYMSHRASDEQDKATANSHAALLAALNTPDASTPGPGATTVPVIPQQPAQNVGFDPEAMGPPTAGPQGPNPQAMAAALGQDPTAAPPAQGGPPMASAPPQAGPMPQPMPQAGPPPAQMAPQGAPPPQMQPQAAPPEVSPLDAALAQRQAEVHRLTVQALDPALSPADRTTMLTQVKTAQEAVTEIQKEKFKQLADESKRQADVARAGPVLKQLVDSGTLPASLAPTMQAAVAAQGYEALKPVIQKMAEMQLNGKFMPMTPQQLAENHLPPNSAVLWNPNTGDAKMLVNGHTMAVEDRNLQLRAQEVANSGANLAIRRAEFNRDALAPPTTVEHIVNGEPVQVTAMFDKRNGRYIDMQGKPVDPTGLRVMPAGSSRATLGLLRVSTAAADAATGIENLSKLPAGSNMGWFSQAANTPMGALKRALTPQEAQDMRTTAAGLSRAMGGLATGGLAVDIPTQQSYEALIPQAGQSRLTALRQMGEMRQQAENGIESALANPYITPAQKANLTAAKTKISNAVPWTPTDVSNLENSKNPNATMHGMGVKTLPAANHNPALMSAADAALAKLGIH